jgi:hypothetical protein
MMLRARYLNFLFGVGAGILAPSCGAWADTPPATSPQSSPPAYFIPGAILADPAIDPVPTLDVPNPRANSSARTQTLAEETPPPCKKDAHADQTQSAQSNCPIDTQKVGGVQLDFNWIDFSSPIYTTFKGQLFGTTEFNFTKSSLDIFQSGAKVGSERQSELELTQVLRYGVTDALSIEASISESPSDIEKEVYPGVPPKTVNQGWQDPGLIAVYRALSQSSSSIYLDLTAEYYPNAFLRSPASGTQEFIFEDSIGHSYGALTLEGITEIMWVGEGRDGTESTPSYWNAQYEIEAFYRFSNRWSASVDAEIQLVDGPFAVHGQVNYYIVPGKLQATLEFEHGISYNEPPLLNESYDRHEQSDVVGVRLGYLFGTGLNGN